ncbi:MAG: UDP-N-acetylmuramoyl-tripeptide--D-alanyl-D-alanine ligase [bacterium]|nr:UDP-N-acetylmuramoyl-tripeptide--D-alanyl-D-alanine ligase [bacterium]
MRLALSEVASIVGGELIGADDAIDGVSVDSRTLRAGELFVPLVAERDGHDFIGDAVTAGAAACLARRDRLDGLGTVAAPLVAVADTEVALRQLGAAARDRFAGTVVGITGSVGKTSTKDLLAAALGVAGPVYASPASFNNSIGVPLTLLGATGTERALIAEIGTNAPGEIADLAALARPHVAVVTAVSAAHTEAFGTLEAVAGEKSDLVAALPVTGTAVLNADDHRVAAMAARTGARVVSYGFGAGDVRAADPTLDGALRPSFVMVTPWGRAPVRLRAAGLHNAHNALAAAAAALVLGVSVEAVAAGLGRAELSPWRMAVGTSASGALIINDAYNANPASAAAALHSLAAAPARRRVAVLGVMAELGERHAAEHAEVADLAAALGIELLAVNETAYGTPPLAGAAEALAALGPLTRGDAVLVKASRVAGLERLALALMDEPDRAGTA